MMIKASDLKKKIYEENLVEELLKKIGMHHIRSHSQGEYITCGMPDGDNQNSTVIYNEENLSVVAYTRENKKITDIISLTQYTQNLSFVESLKFICNELDLDNDIDLFPIRKIQQTPAEKFIKKIENKSNFQNNIIKEDVKIYSQDYIEQYSHSCYANISSDFEKDNIPASTQRLFDVIPYLEEVGIDWKTTYYNIYDLIPIYDEIGCIVGIKARRYGYSAEKFGKYYYLLPCEKSAQLYSLFYTKEPINSKKEVIICEAEKGVMQLWNYGFKNSVAVSGHKISQQQIEKIVKLEVDKVIIAFDEDVEETTLYNEYQKLKYLVKEVVCIIDKQHILNSKESPMDNPEKWKKLYKECQFIPKVWSDDEC